MEGGYCVDEVKTLDPRMRPAINRFISILLAVSSGMGPKARGGRRARRSSVSFLTVAHSPSPLEGDIHLRTLFGFWVQVGNTALPSSPLFCSLQADRIVFGGDELVVRADHI